MTQPPTNFLPLLTFSSQHTNSHHPPSTTTTMTMKLNKSKGKVHPSPSSSSSSPSFSLSSISNSDPVSSLNLLLPAAILTLISVLSLQDREVLAYMITRSLKSAANPALVLEENNTHNRKTKSKSKKSHKSPTFDCGCFDCYTSYWFRWDSSPHRELIHQAIEAFEEHLSTTERASHKSTKGSRRREKGTKDKSHKTPETVVNVVEERVVLEPPRSPVNALKAPATVEEVRLPAKEETLPESVAPAAKEERESEEETNVGHKEEKQKEQQLQREQQHKGLARKVLPDVIGLFNSRLWNLWGPNV